MVQQSTLVISTFICYGIVTILCNICVDLDAFKSDISIGNRIIGSYITEILGIGLVSCMKACQEYKSCRSVNWHLKQVCQLMAQNHPISPADGFVFTSKNNWSSVNLSGSCFNTECPENSKCVENIRGVECRIIGCVGHHSSPRINQTKFKAKPLWYLGSTILSPCLYGQSEEVICSENGTWSDVYCDEAKPKDCADAYNRTVFSNVSTHAIDVDGSGPLSEIKVKCFIANNSTIITSIEHNATGKAHVDGFEAKYSYSLKIEYNISMEHMVSLINMSEGCRQLLKYECKHIQFTLSSVWLNRRSEMMEYFAGNGTDQTVCACDLTSPCREFDTGCICDKNDNVWREDVGYLTNRHDLPMTAFLSGDTGGVTEEAYVTVGPLDCWR